MNVEETLTVLLTKVIPTLMNKIDSQELVIKRLNELSNERYGEIQEAFEFMRQDFYEEINKIKEELIETAQFTNTEPLEEEKPNKRQQTDYNTYVKVKDLSDKGYLDKEIGTELGIPYTTVRAYLRWTDVQVAKKKQQWDAKQSKKRYVEPNEPVIVEQTVELTEAACDETEAMLSIPVEIEPITQWHPNGGLPMTFNEWTKEDRDNAAFDKEYYPDGVTKDMIVVVRRDGDAYSMPFAVKEIDWSSDIDAWRLATEAEQTQYIARAVNLL